MPSRAKCCFAGGKGVAAYSPVSRAAGAHMLLFRPAATCSSDKSPAHDKLGTAAHGYGPIADDRQLCIAICVLSYCDMLAWAFSTRSTATGFDVTQTCARVRVGR